MTVSSTSTTPLRAGIIGCGWFGGVHVERLSNIPNVSITAVSDPSESAMQRVTDLIPPHARDPQTPTVAQYTDWRDLLRHEGLDFVSINSPNLWHVEQLLAALEHNLHVLCEKPLSMEPEEVRRVVEATQSSDRVVAISYQSRYRRDSRLLRAALQSGRWGNITSIDIFASEDWITPNIGTWRHDPARCPGGYFGDANGHQLDVLFWMTDLEPEWVRATTETRGTPVPMVTWGEARLRGQRAETRDRTLPFTFSFVGDARIWREEISIITEKADFVIRDTQLLWSEGSGPLAPFSANILENDELSDPNLPDLPDSAFVAALRGGPPVLSAPETVWPVLRFTRSALASASNGSQAQSALTY